MAIIDAQVHAYERDHPGRPWAGTLAGPAEVTGSDMVTAMDAVGVDGAVLVSPYSMYRYDASYALQVHAGHPGRFCLVKPVDPEDPAVAETVADWAEVEGAVAVQDHDGLRGFEGPGPCRRLARAARRRRRRPAGQPALLGDSGPGAGARQGRIRTRGSSSTISA